MWAGIVLVKDDLTLQKWTYIMLNDHEKIQLILDRVEFASRPNTRHKFRIGDIWDRHYNRQNTIPKPEPPERVKQEIKQMFINQITVG